MTLGDGEINSRGAKSFKMGGSLKNNNNNSQDPLGKSHNRDIRMIGGNLIFLDGMTHESLSMIRQNSNVQEFKKSFLIYMKYISRLFAH